MVHKTLVVAEQLMKSILNRGKSSWMVGQLNQMQIQAIASAIRMPIKAKR